MAQIILRGGMWYSDFRHKGKRIRRALSTDKRDAQVKLGKLLGDTRSNGPLTDISWEAFREKYLAHSEGTKRGSTPKRDRAAIRAMESYKVPRRLPDVGPEFLEGWKAYRRGQGKGNATINRDMNAVKAMLKVAVNWGHLTAFDGGSVRSLKETMGRLVFHSPKELRRLLDACKGAYPGKSSNEHPYDWLTVGLLGSRAGLRRGEILHTSWADISGRVLSVTPKPCKCDDCAQDGSRWNPKTFQQRHIPIADDLAARLKAIPRRSEWVLEPRPSLDVASVYFHKIAAKAGLPGGLHTLRHTFASHLAQAGVPLYTISKLLGHSDIKMTMRYAHLCPATLDHAIKLLPVL